MALTQGYPGNLYFGKFSEPSGPGSCRSSRLWGYRGIGNIPVFPSVPPAISALLSVWDIF